MLLFLFLYCFLIKFFLKFGLIIIVAGFHNNNPASMQVHFQRCTNGDACVQDSLHRTLAKINSIQAGKPPVTQSVNHSWKLWSVRDNLLDGSPQFPRLANPL